MTQALEKSLDDLVDSILTKTESLRSSRSLVESPRDYGQRIYPHVNKILWYAILNRLNGYLRLSLDTGTSEKASRLLLSKAQALLELVPCLINLGAISRKDDAYQAIIILSNQLEERQLTAPKSI